MSNGGAGESIQTLMFDLIDAKLGVPVKDRYDWGPLLELRKIFGTALLKRAEDLTYPNAPKGKDKLPLPLPLESYEGVRIFCHIIHSFCSDSSSTRYITIPATHL